MHFHGLCLCLCNNFDRAGLRKLGHDFGIGHDVDLADAAGSEPLEAVWRRNEGKEVERDSSEEGLQRRSTERRLGGRAKSLRACVGADLCAFVLTGVVAVHYSFFNMLIYFF